MSYIPFPIFEVSIDELQLDLDNYRIPTHREDQAAALSYLFASEDVLGAARLILRNGYFDNEVPIVVKDDGEYVVLEGNRRVSALKALRDPGLVPEHETEVRALMKRYAVEVEGLPDAIRVLETPDRDAAAPHIARLHTGLSKKRWSRDQQATYYYSLLGPHTTVDDIKARYPEEGVVRFIKMAVVRRFLAGVRFSDHSLHEYVTGPALTMSAFEYAYRRDDIAQAIGVTFDKDGHLLPTGRKPEKIGEGLSPRQREALEYLVTEFRAARLNTRSPEFKVGTEQHKDLVAVLTGLGGNRVSDDTVDFEEDTVDSEEDASEMEESNDEERVHGEKEGFTDNEPGSDDTENQRTGRGPNHPDTKDTLQLSGIPYETAPVALYKRYYELRRLSLRAVPVATAMLVRSILETTIKFHFESTNTPASGQLAESIKVLADAYGSEKAIKRQIDMIRSGSASKPGSVQWFNVVSHGVNEVVKADQVREAWEVVSPVLRRLLAPPVKTSS